MPVDLWTRHPPEVLQDIVKRIVEGVLTEELPELVATIGSDIGQNLRDNQSHSLALQRRENRAQRLGRRKVYVVDGGGGDTEPS